MHSSQHHYGLGLTGYDRFRISPAKLAGSNLTDMTGNQRRRPRARLQILTEFVMDNGVSNRMINFAERQLVAQKLLRLCTRDIKSALATQTGSARLRVHPSYRLQPVLTEERPWAASDSEILLEQRRSKAK